MKKIFSQGKLPESLVKKLLKTIITRDQNVLIPPGIGLDAAGLKLGKNLIAVTTDPITLASDEIATYSIAVNINDVACLGAIPRWYSAVLLLPLGIEEAMIKKIWQKLTKELKRFNITAIGGHIEVTPQVNAPLLVGQIIGERKAQKFFDPRNAKPKDQIILVRPIAIEGTALLAKERECDLKNLFKERELKKIQNLLYKPGICVWPIAEKIIKENGIIAMHDPTEGGVATALHEMATAANLGLSINGNAISILDATKKLAAIFNFNPLGLLASGSLLIACKPKATKRIIGKLKGLQPVLIGEFTSKKSKTIFYGSIKKTLPKFSRDEIVAALLKKITLSYPG